MRSVTGVGRVAALGAVIVAIALVAIILFGAGSNAYEIKAHFINAGQLVKGNPVQLGGVSVGSVRKIRITDDGQAEVTMKIDDAHSPLRVGTRARIRQFSQSGIANRYIDLTIPPNGAGGTIPKGGVMGVDSTTTQVDLDQLFNTLDPKTRKAVQDFFKGNAKVVQGYGDLANRGYRYLNPALSTSNRLFGELTRDEPVLDRFLVDSSKLVTALAERSDDLAGVISNVNDTTRALGNQKVALAQSIALLPPTMRRANTTFVNLRAALDDLDPLVNASKPVAKKLGPFLHEARLFANGARPTVRDLRLAVRRRGRGNDLIELINGIPPLADIAVDTQNRTIAPGGRAYNLGSKRGAFPEAVDAFKGSSPIIAQGRPYTADLFGWFDDFSTTGPGFDALGSNARAFLGLGDSASLFNNGSPNSAPVINGGPVFKGDFKPCPGASEVRAVDGSNVFSADQQARLSCTEANRHSGDVNGR